MFCQYCFSGFPKYITCSSNTVFVFMWKPEPIFTIGWWWPVSPNIPLSSPTLIGKVLSQKSIFTEKYFHRKVFSQWAVSPNIPLSWPTLIGKVQPSSSGIQSVGFGLERGEVELNLIVNYHHKEKNAISLKVNAKSNWWTNFHGLWWINTWSKHSTFFVNLLSFRSNWRIILKDGIYWPSMQQTLICSRRNRVILGSIVNSRLI